MKVCAGKRSTDEKTRAYYELKGDLFFRATRGIDPSSFLSDFERALPLGAHVLDVGCGSGRDMLWLKKRGHHPQGLELSSKLARLAQEYSGCPVTLGDLLTTALLQKCWQGILVSGVLVHLSRGAVPSILQALARALSEDGVLYISVKEGVGTFCDADHRRFYYWQDADFKKVARDAGLALLSMTRSPSARGSKDTWLGYLFQLKGGR